MEALKKCFNPKVLIGLAILAIGVAIFAPKALPLLLLAACPLTMVLMMEVMGKRSQSDKQALTVKNEKTAKVDEPDVNKLRSLR